MGIVRNSEIGPVADHGGALDRAAARFGAGPDWLDLSTGINPWPYPIPALPDEAWHRLPEQSALAALKQAARDYYGAPAEAAMVAGPGSQALIQGLPRLLPPNRVAVLAPSYAEHVRCWRLAGHAVSEVTVPGAAETILVMTNPNNPDGRRFAPDALIGLAETMAERGGLLIIDEAFADMEAELSMAPKAGMPGLVVLRSFGKFFGLAGLRLGFAFGPAGLIDRLEAALGPWAVSGPALEIGRAALADAPWIAATRARLARAAAGLTTLLSAHRLEPVGGTDLYRLVRSDRAAALHEALGRQHILVRDFAARPDWLRFGLPPDAQAMARLGRALGDGRHTNAP
jgi:cobalamin biosynthetic protein CobC